MRTKGTSRERTTRPVHRSSAHSFSFLIWASSSGVKSLTMLKSFRIWSRGEAGRMR